MDAVRTELERRLDVVVDDERRAQVAKRLAPLDQLVGRGAFDAQLDDGRALGDCCARRVEVVDEDVELHEILARPASVVGSRLKSAS